MRKRRFHSKHGVTFSTPMQSTASAFPPLKDYQRKQKELVKPAFWLALLANTTAPAPARAWEPL
eukprot:766802-Hanusia_phi.AAC.2